MKHLTTNEVIGFVMLDHTLSDEERAWAMDVNNHIRSCPMCLEAVQTYGRLYDAFLEMRDSGAYTDFLSGLQADGSFEYRVAEDEQQTDSDTDALF